MSELVRRPRPQYCVHSLFSDYNKSLISHLGNEKERKKKFLSISALSCGCSVESSQTLCIGVCVCVSTGTAAFVGDAFFFYCCFFYSMFPAELLMFNIRASCLRGLPADTTATNEPKKIQIFVEPEENCVKATLHFFLAKNETFESFTRAVGLEP